MKTWRALTVPLMAMALVAGACGDDDDESAPEVTSPPLKEAPVYTVGVTEEGDRYSFEVPSGIKGGGATFELDNTGQKVHDFQLARIDGQHTDEELINLVAGDEVPVPDWIHGEGGVGNTAPGAKVRSTVELQQGEYVYFCQQNDEDQEGEAQEPADVSLTYHIAKGMLGRFTVSGNSGASLPEADATVTATDYTFSTPASLDSGKSVLAFVNDGQQLHHLIMFPIVEGRTIDDVREAFTSEEEPTGPPPIEFEEAIGLEVLDPGRTEVTEVELERGRYAMVCFLPDRGTSGPPHAAKGMLVEVNVE